MPDIVQAQKPTAFPLTSGITLITNPLGIPSNQFDITQNNSVVGSKQNAKNALAFYFPVATINAIEDIAVIAAFRANQARATFGKTGYDPFAGKHSGEISRMRETGDQYFPDPDENVDMTKAFGNYLFTPSYGALTLGNTDPHIRNGNQYTGVDGLTYTFENLVLPIALIEMNQPSRIGKTNITGSPGSVKQYIALDDWNITISSVVMYDVDQAPVPFMEALYRLKQAPVAIPVTNYFLNAFGVTHIVIEDISPVQQEGGYSAVAFTIKACSDIPLTDFLP